MKRVKYHFITNEEDFERMVEGKRLKKTEEYLNKVFSPFVARTYRKKGSSMIGGWDWINMLEDHHVKQITISTDILGDYWKRVQIPYSDGVLSIMIPRINPEDGKNRAPYQVFFNGRCVNIEDEATELTRIFDLLETYRALGFIDKANAAEKRLNEILIKANKWKILVD